MSPVSIIKHFLGEGLPCMKAVSAVDGGPYANSGKGGNEQVRLPCSLKLHGLLGTDTASLLWTKTRSQTFSQGLSEAQKQ